jgi:hypothetical protein
MKLTKQNFQIIKKYEYEGGISHLGLLGTNRYSDMWKERKVYK